MINKKSSRGGNYMNGGTSAKKAEQNKKASRHVQNSYRDVEFIPPVEKPTIPREQIRKTIRSVMKQHEKAT